MNFGMPPNESPHSLRRVPNNENFSPPSHLANSGGLGNSSSESQSNLLNEANINSSLLAQLNSDSESFFPGAYEKKTVGTPISIIYKK